MKSRPRLIVKAKPVLIFSTNSKRAKKAKKNSKLLK